MKESPPNNAFATLDELIVSLHTLGENVFQAMARAISLGAARHDAALLTEVPEAQLPFPNGGTTKLPRLDAAGVAAICNFEIEQATHETDRILVREPRPPAKPRVTSNALHQALSDAGYFVGSHPKRPGREYTPRRRLAEHTGISLRMIDRICTGKQKTVATETAITIFEELGAHGEADELNATLRAWGLDMHFYHYDRLEYLEKLELIAPRLLTLGVPFTRAELMAVHDLHVLLREAHREESTEEHVLTAEERLTAGERRFRDTYGRDPLPLPVRLKKDSHDLFQAERRTAVRRQRALHKGLAQPKQVSVRAVYARRSRLRQAGRLPKGSKPRAFQPPVDFHDIFAFDERHKL